MPAETALGCSYCGLPIARGFAPSADRPRYCCFGCKFAAAVTAESGDEGQVRWTLARLGLAIFFTMNVMVFAMALWTQEVYESPDSQIANTYHELLRWASLLFAAPVLLLLGGPLLENAVDSVKRRVLSTDVLLIVGVAAAFLLSVRSVVVGTGPVYFEVACVVLVAVTLGRWFEATGRLKTTQALRSLDTLLPSHVRRVAAQPPDVARPINQSGIQPPDASSGTEVESLQNDIPLAAVGVGDWLRVLPGERIPVDGIIRRNHAAIDEQIVTGESQPAVKEPGDRVLAGTLNLDGDLLIEVTIDPSQGTLPRLIDAVCAAAMSRSKLQQAADHIAAVFLPIVLVIAIASSAVHAFRSGTAQGVLAGLSVLLIACPCALGIATPMALWVAIGQAARVGVLFRHGDALQRLANVRALCFDKTGTLTTGDSEVVNCVTDEQVSRTQVLKAAACLAAASTHNFSRAIQRYVQDQCSDETLPAVPLASMVHTCPGRGLRAQMAAIAGDVYLGSSRFMEESGLTTRSSLRESILSIRAQGQSLVCIGWEGRVQAAFAFREQLREEAAEAIQDLRSQSLHICILTGDHAARGSRIERQLGCPVKSELLPDDKLAIVRTLSAQLGSIAMVGDGINDAPALAAADVGIAMGCGADVSRDAAQVCLLGNDLRRIGWAIRLAKGTVRVIYGNLFWTFFYNLVGIAIAAVGWLNPIWAAAAMVASSLFVISNSLRLAAVSTELPPNSGPTASRPVLMSPAESPV